MRQLLATAALLVVASSAFGLVRAYSIEPVSAQLSGWADTVSQVITTCFDSLTEPAYIEGFFGDDANPQGYRVEVLTYPGPGQVVVARGDTSAVRGHTWVRFSNLNVIRPESIVKGRQLEIRFSRTSGSDSIQYYWSEAADGGPYRYGEMATGNSVYLNADLCARVYGVMDTVSAADFGATCLLTR